jgi:phage terminase Nu1 subunit (DNA packaging protein)
MGELSSQGDLARAVDLSTRRVRDLEKQGVFKKTARGKYDKDENVRFYIRYLRKVAVGSGDANLTDVKTRREIARAEREELLVKKIKGDLVPKHQAEQWLGDIVREVRQHFISLPRRVAGAIVLKTDERDVEVELRSEIHKILEQLAKPLERKERKHGTRRNKNKSKGRRGKGVLKATGLLNEKVTEGFEPIRENA